MGKNFKFYLTDEIYNRLRKISDKTLIPMSAIIRRAIAAELDKMEKTNAP